MSIGDALRKVDDEQGLQLTEAENKLRDLVAQALEIANKNEIPFVAIMRVRYRSTLRCAGVGTPRGQAGLCLAMAEQIAAMIEKADGACPVYGEGCGHAKH